MDGIEKIYSFVKRTYSPSTAFARSGYFSELATFRLINTRLQGHPTTHDNLPGVRIASGSLGQGLSVKHLPKQKC
jgi:transketolase